MQNPQYCDGCTQSHKDGLRRIKIRERIQDFPNQEEYGENGGKVRELIFRRKKYEDEEI